MDRWQQLVKEVWNIGKGSWLSGSNVIGETRQGQKDMNIYEGMDR